MLSRYHLEKLNAILAKENVYSRSVLCKINSKISELVDLPIKHLVTFF
jgi:hypothetical protein